MTRRNNRRSATTRRTLKTNASRQRLNCAVSPEFAELLNNEALRAEWDEKDLTAILEAADDIGLYPEDVVNASAAGAIFFYPNCEDMGAVAYEYLRETGAFTKENEWMERYFDYDQYGNDMTYDADFGWSPTIKGFVEFQNY